MGEVTKETLYQARVQRHGEVAVQKLQNACVGIAGLGGLGSHIATLPSGRGRSCSGFSRRCPSRFTASPSEWM